MVIFGGTLPATRIAVSAIDPIALTSPAHGHRRALLARAAAGVAPAAAAARAMAATDDRDALRRRLFSVPDGARSADRRRLAWRRGARNSPDCHRACCGAITHERPGPLFWIASIAGAALVILFALRQGGGALSAGDLLLFASVVVSAIGFAFPAG